LEIPVICGKAPGSSNGFTMFHLGPPAVDQSNRLFQCSPKNRRTSWAGDPEKNCSEHIRLIR
jgi:hypothetical protein